nr:Unknown Function [uncultured bacterium]
MTVFDNVCDVCHRQADKVHVHSSGVAPMSFASCIECLLGYVEPESLFHFLYDCVGNKGEGLTEGIAVLNTWKDGKYMTWNEWVAWRRDPVRVAELDAEAERDLVAYYDALGNDSETIQ